MLFELLERLAEVRADVFPGGVFKFGDLPVGPGLPEGKLERFVLVSAEAWLGRAQVGVVLGYRTAFIGWSGAQKRGDAYIFAQDHEWGRGLIVLSGHPFFLCHSWWGAPLLFLCSRAPVVPVELARGVIPNFSGLFPREAVASSDGVEGLSLPVETFQHVVLSWLEKGVGRTQLGVTRGDRHPFNDGMCAPEFDEAGKVKGFSHRFEPPRPTSFELPQGGTLSFLAQFSARKEGVAAYAVAYRTPVALKADGGATLDWFLETVHDLQVLISLLMGRAARTVELKGCVRHETGLAPHAVQVKEFQVFFHSRHAWARLPEQQVEENELLALPQLEDDLPTVLSRWFGDADKFRQAARLYHDNLNQSERFTALRFLTTAQAVETAHRRLFGESHFSESDVAGYEAIRETIIADLATTDLSA